MSGQFSMRLVPSNDMKVEQNRVCVKTRTWKDVKCVFKIRKKMKNTEKVIRKENRTKWLEESRAGRWLSCFDE